jgi:homoserine kinase type II
VLGRREAERVPHDPTPELVEVMAHYNLGKLIRQEKDLRGTVNTSYFIETLQDGARRKYFLREYKAGIQREEILFEHALIEHASREGSCPVARVHPTHSGATYFERPPGEGRPASFFAVFDYLHGEDRYSWVGPRLPRAETRNAGALLARFHRAAHTLRPRGRRGEPKIGQLIDVIDSHWSESPSRSKGTVFDRFLADHHERVQRSIAGTRRALHAPAARRLPEVVIHSDYHPGNLKFEGHEISGLVDFDWSKIDWRAFDVGLAVWYFCVSWAGPADGRLRIGEARDFLTAYQRTLLASPGLAPLSKPEIGYLPQMINAGNIYVLYWTLRDYFSKDVDPPEYLVYLRHGVAFARWFDGPRNQERLARMLAELPRTGGGPRRERG